LKYGKLTHFRLNFCDAILRVSPFKNSFNGLHFPPPISAQKNKEILLNKLKIQEKCHSFFADYKWKKGKENLLGDEGFSFENSEIFDSFILFLNSWNDFRKIKDFLAKNLPATLNDKWLFLISQLKEFFHFLQFNNVLFTRQQTFLQKNFFQNFICQKKFFLKGSKHKNGKNRYKSIQIYTIFCKIHVSTPPKILFC
jgi:hypothetical protein